jgi:peptide deformylase
MGIRNIVTLPDPVLRRKARPVTAFDQDLQKLIDDMVETMRAAPGVGLAAPQVSVAERLIIVEYAEPPEEDDAAPEGDPGKVSVPLPEVKPRLYVVANPVMMKASSEMVLGVEGCLSIPGLVGEVERHASIQVNGLNRRGQPVKIRADGWLARIFQHEIDHVNGVVFPDRAIRLWKPEPDEVEDRV